MLYINCCWGGRERKKAICGQQGLRTVPAHLERKGRETPLWEKDSNPHVSSRKA